MRILVVGNMWIGSNARSLADGFSELGHETRRLDTTDLARPHRFSRGWRDIRRRGTIGRAPNMEMWHRMHAIEADWSPDLLVAFKTVLLDQSILLESSASLKVHYSPDDASNGANTSPAYLASESQWDLIVTTKSYNVEEIIGRGTPKVLYVESAYDPAIHYGEPATPARRFMFGFLGAARSDRENLPRIFGSVEGQRSIILGPKWRRRYPLGWPNVKICGPVDGTDFAAAAAQIFAGPILLNSANRDRHTCRSFEVPACGLLTIAQRTDEHRRLYDEGSECLMFSTHDELLDVMKRVAANPQTFQSMAERGQRRIVAGNNTYRDRADSIVRDL